MPDSTLKYDPSSFEGRAIGALFRDIKWNIEHRDGNWPGTDTVEAVKAFFTGLGIDAEGSVYQVDPIPPQAISPRDDPDTVAPILAAHPGFTTNSDPSTTEGLFYAHTVTDRINDYTLLTFPHAGPARLRTALSLLRALGYTANEHPLDTRTDARHIAVEAGALYPLTENAPAADQALSLLYDAGFTHHPDPGHTPEVTGHTTPVTVDGRPGWLQIDVVGPHTSRYTRKEHTRHIAELLTTAGWTVEHRSIQTLHTTPPPNLLTATEAADAEPTHEPVPVPADVLNSIRQVVAYNWASEQHDYNQQDHDGQKHHIANHLNRIAEHWNLHPAPASD